MGIFRKNPNEANYQGGKKHWVDVIKNTGPADQLLFRQGEEDFNTNSTLIVMPGEKALFVNRGVIEAQFSEGTYKLSTQNYPFISRLKNAFSGGISAFHCVVYFVRDAHTAEILWGTDTPIQVRDPFYHIQTHVQARGAYKVSIENPPLFLRKLVGSIRQYTGPEDLDRFFASEFQQHIRSRISSCILESGQDVLTVCTRQAELADQIREPLAEVMKAYGLCLESFTIAALEIPEDDPNRKALEKAMAQNVTMNMMGDNWDKQKNYEMMGKALDQMGKNAGPLAGFQTGVSLGASLAGTTSQIFDKTLGNLGTAPQKAPEEDEMTAKLKKLKSFLSAGLISQEQYDAKVKEFLSDL